MITRFDHAVIGVADLERAVEAYRALGFVVRPGGRHTGEGTHNAIVRFGLDYLELMAVEDADLAGSRPFGAQLLESLRGREGGLIGYVVAGQDLDALTGEMRRSELDPIGPVAMERQRPDGRSLKWRLLFPRGQRWRDIAPFVIEWITSDADRLAWDETLPHSNGVTGVDGLVIVVRDLPQASVLYERGLGQRLTPHGRGRVRVALGDVSVDLVAESDPAAGQLHERGEGLAELTLRVRDIGRAAAVIPGLIPDADGMRYRIPEQSAQGARLVLSEVSGSES